MVLVAAFVNNSGDRALDSSLQFTLERELSTGSLHLLAPARVHDVLRLMRQPTNAVLIPALAREIAVRAVR